MKKLIIVLSISITLFSCANISEREMKINNTEEIVLKVYNAQIRGDIETFKSVVNKVGCAIIGQTPLLAPADKKLYSIRDIVGAVESLPLITSSILSKKIASGLNALVLDVKTGNGSFNKTETVAKKLAAAIWATSADDGDDNYNNSGTAIAEEESPQK